MIQRPRHTDRARLAGTLLLALAILVAGSWAVAPALAGQNARKPWSLFDLFAPRRERPPEPLRVAPSVKAKAKAKPRAPKARGVARAAEAPEIAAVEKRPDAKTVLVAGDFLGGALAEGLVEEFAQDAGIRVIDRSNGSSGFVRNDHYDWPGAVDGLVQTEKPAVIVVMMGANDRQQMQVGETREILGTEAWNREYAARTAVFASTVAATRVPLIWVGMPAFKSTRMSTDMLAFNDIYRASVTSAGGEFVDIWDGFVDENGAFVMSGPDINGQSVRLRGNDGINMTRAGKQKLAFYVEKPLRKLLGVPATAPGAVALPGLPAGQPASPDMTVPVSLFDPDLDGGTELLGGPTTPQTVAQPASPAAPGGTGALPAAPAGRADDFTYPPPQLPATAGTTTAINP